jgi:hypothetical protein
MDVVVPAALDVRVEQLLGARCTDDPSLICSWGRVLRVNFIIILQLLLLSPESPVFVII